MKEVSEVCRNLDEVCKAIDNDISHINIMTSVNEFDVIKQELQSHGYIEDGDSMPVGSPMINNSGSINSQGVEQKWRRHFTVFVDGVPAGDTTTVVKVGKVQSISEAKDLAKKVKSSPAEFGIAVEGLKPHDQLTFKGKPFRWKWNDI